MPYTSDLKERWLCLLAHSSEPCYLDKVFNQLEEKYREPHRAYHTLEHISACLHHLDNVLSRLSQPLDQPLEVELALWLHDVIYDPKKHDNEIQSAHYAEQLLRQTNLDSRQIAQVAHLIRLTQHPAIPTTKDEQYLLDIDLSIVGAQTEVFDRYERNIRHEYAHVPRFFYRRGRKKLLRGFLARERIYASDYFYDLYERQARNNLQRALDAL